MTFCVGLDLGQAQDYTAMAIVEQSHPLSADGRPLAAHYAVRDLRRWSLGTSYTAIVQDVHRLMRTSPLSANVPLVIDGTGVGRAVTDLFRAVGQGLVPVSIHGGDKTTRDEETKYWRVPKRELASVVSVLLQNRRLAIAEALDEAPTLAQELRAFKAHISLGGHDSYGAATSGLADDWRTGVHDDLVLSVALACWWAERPKPRYVTPIAGGHRPQWSSMDPAYRLGAAGRADDWRALEAQQAEIVRQQMAQFQRGQNGD